MHTCDIILNIRVYIITVIKFLYNLVVKFKYILLYEYLIYFKNTYKKVNKYYIFFKIIFLTKILKKSDLFKISRRAHTLINNIQYTKNYKS